VEQHKRLLFFIVCSVFLLMLGVLTLTACSSQPQSGEIADISKTGLQQEVLTGFPPPIPHKLDRGDDCLVCHRQGEVGEAPKTPHPENIPCRQCHVLSE